MYSETKNHDYLQNKIDRWICSPSVSILLRWCLCLIWKYSLKLVNSRLLTWKKLTNSLFTTYPAVKIINNITTEVSFVLFPIKKSASIFLDYLSYGFVDISDPSVYFSFAKIVVHALRKYLRKHSFNWSGESKASALNITFAEGFLHIIFTNLRKCPLIPSITNIRRYTCIPCCLRITLNHKMILNFIDCFFSLIKIIIRFFFFSLLRWITQLYLLMLRRPYMPGVMCWLIIIWHGF